MCPKNVKSSMGVKICRIGRKFFHFKMPLKLMYNTLFPFTSTEKHASKPIRIIMPGVGGGKIKHLFNNVCSKIKSNLDSLK